jgi:hypothetical protein
VSAPNTLGEWDAEIAKQRAQELERYRAALEVLRGWEAFKGAFAWTRMFVLEQSINYELEKRSRAHGQ